VSVGVDRALSHQAEVLVVPGGGWNDGSPVGVRAEMKKGTIPKALTIANQRGATVAGVCTGALLLAAAGLTEGRPAITHQDAVEELRASGAVVIQTRVVDDGDIVTAGGVTSSLDLALWLVERYYGSTLAEKIARAMEYDRRWPVWDRGLSRRSG
jgi:transcriptional regulator GlxA family with amidase domain